MKRLLTTFLVASLLITTALSFSSCKKTDTNANTEEWIPTVYNFVTAEDSSSRDKTADCPYCEYDVAFCNHGVQWWSAPDIYCPLGPYDPVTNPIGHFHEHIFLADEDCTPPGQSNYICPYLGVRKHKHLVVYWQNGWDNHWHLGGAISSDN